MPYFAYIQIRLEKGDIGLSWSYHKNEKAELTGVVKVYLPEGYMIYDCKVEKEVLVNGWCRIKDDLNCEWYGKVKYYSGK